MLQLQVWTEKSDPVENGKSKKNSDLYRTGKKIDSFYFSFVFFVVFYMNWFLYHISHIAPYRWWIIQWKRIIWTYVWCMCYSQSKHLVDQSSGVPTNIWLYSITFIAWFVPIAKKCRTIRHQLAEKTTCQFNVKTVKIIIEKWNRNELFVDHLKIFIWLFCSFGWLKTGKNQNDMLATKRYA